jgi:hypothetical protein
MSTHLTNLKTINLRKLYKKIQEKNLIFYS